MGYRNFQVELFVNLKRKCLKARLQRRFLSQQLDATFVALKLQLQNRTCKLGAIFIAICRGDIAGVSNMFETWCNFGATKIASSCRDKNRLCKRALDRKTLQTMSKQIIGGFRLPSLKWKKNFLWRAGFDHTSRVWYPLHHRENHAGYVATYCIE